MKAVNLIPAEDRRGAGGAAGRSGGAVYILLAALAALALVATAYTMSNRSIKDKRAKVAQLESQATAAEAQAAQLQSYTTFAGLRQKRLSTVQSIAASRFDWAHTMHEISRTIPSNVSLTTIVGTVSPGMSVQGGGSGASGLRGDLAVPAIELSGCTTSQNNVAKMMTAMRQVDGVQRVSLQSSTKNAGASGASGGGACANGTKHDPQFSMVVFLTPSPTVTAPATPTTQNASQPTTTTTEPGQ